LPQPPARSVAIEVQIVTQYISQTNEKMNENESQSPNDFFSSFSADRRDEKISIEGKRKGFSRGRLRTIAICPTSNK
jgi:hypothetical protein